MNPVFHKDLLGMLRLKRIAAIQALFVIVLTGLLVLTWPHGGMLVRTKGQDDLLVGLVLGQMVLMILFVPGVAAVSLTGEREANTLEMLYASRLSASQIIVGKIASAISFPLLLLVSGLPFVGLLNYRGDVEAGELIWAYGILVATAIFLAVLSLTISAVSKQTSTALVISYVVVLTVCGGVLVPAAIMLETQSGLIATALHYVRAVSPVAAVLSQLRPDLPGDFAGKMHQNLPSYQIFLPVAGLVVVVCFGILVGKLRQPPVEPDSFGTTALEDRTLGRRFMYLIDPKKKRKPFGGINPVITKESRTSGLRSGRWMIRIFYGLLVLSLGLAAMSLYGGTEHQDILQRVFQVMVAFQVGAVALVTPSLTSAAISGEIEGGTFEMLRLTRLKGGQIFWGKFLPAFFPALLPVVALAPAYGAICFIDPGYLQYLKLLLPVIVLAVVLCSTLGLICSCFTPNTARATVTAYLITAALFVLPMLAWWGAAAGMFGGRAVEVMWSAALPSPLVVALNLRTEVDNPIRDGFFLHLYIVGGLCLVLLLAARLRLTALLRKG